jgi:hypothetical protein
MRKIHTIMTLTVNCRGLGEKRATNRAEPVPQAHGQAVVRVVAAFPGNPTAAQAAGRGR